MQVAFPAGEALGADVKPTQVEETLAPWGSPPTRCLDHKHTSTATMVVELVALHRTTSLGFLLPRLLPRLNARPVRHRDRL